MLFNSHIMLHVELKVISSSSTVRGAYWEFEFYCIWNVQTLCPLSSKPTPFFCLCSEHIGSNLVSFLQHSFILLVTVCFVLSNLIAIVGKLLYLWLISGLHMLSPSRQLYADVAHGGFSKNLMTITSLCVNQANCWRRRETKWTQAHWTSQNAKQVICCERNRPFSALVWQSMILISSRAHK